jgi:hypothetical protein
MSYKVIDDFFTTRVADSIQQSIIVDNVADLLDLPCNVREYSNMNSDLFQATKSYTRMLMRKNLVEHEPSAKLVYYILQNLGPLLKVRFVVSSIRVNYMNQTCAEPTLKYDVPHIDIKNISKNMYTLIYYVNDSHGDTILYRETSRGSVHDDIPTNPTCLNRIAPKKNRLLIFNANQLHSAPAYCTEDRYVINLNITTEFPLDYDQL